MRARLAPLLLCCCGLAWAAVAGSGATGPAEPAAQPATAAAPRASATAAALPTGPPGPWTEQVERPLFTPGRRPPPAVAATPPVAEAPPEPPAPVAANGVVLRPAGAVALLRLADERVVRAAQGDEVEGWVVARIGAEDVVLSRGGRVLRLPVRARSADGLLRH